MTALAEGAAAVESRPGYAHPTLASHAKGGPDYLQGLVVAMDPMTGNVRALVGGRNYADSPFDRALYALRQPGSAFKPVVYAAAIADSIPANAIVSDTARSRNTVAVQLAMRVGIDSVIDLGHRLGLTTPIAPYPSSAIGASGVRPIEMVAAYGAFATLGTVAPPQFVVRIEDRGGHTVWTAHPAMPATRSSSAT